MTKVAAVVPIAAAEPYGDDVPFAMVVLAAPLLIDGTKYLHLSTPPLLSLFLFAEGTHNLIKLFAIGFTTLMVRIDLYQVNLIRIRAWYDG